MPRCSPVPGCAAMHMSRSTETEHETELYLNCVRQGGITAHGVGCFPRKRRTICVQFAWGIGKLCFETAENAQKLPAWAAGNCLRRRLRRAGTPHQTSRLHTDWRPVTSADTRGTGSGSGQGPPGGGVRV
eukprot:4034793-Prymnesium_polylepis.1